MNALMREPSIALQHLEAALEDRHVEMRHADIVDLGQERGEIATQGGDAKRDVRSPDISTLDDIGLKAQRLSEARTLRNGYTDADLLGAQGEGG